MQRWNVVLLNAGKVSEPSDNELRAMVIASSAALVGMSSEETARIELRACALAAEHDKPIALFSDTFGAYRRGWFAPFRRFVRAVFVVTESEVAGAQAMYPKAKIVATGNPAWEAFFDAGDRNAARAAMGAQENEKVVFISGTKSLLVNQEMIMTTLGAVQIVSRSASAENLRVVLSLHPGDTNLEEVYGGMTKSFLGVRLTLLPGSVMPGDSAVYGADIVLTYNAASVAMRAIAHGIPVIALDTPLAAERLLSESGTKENPLFAARAAHWGGTTSGELALALVYALHEPNALKAAQAAFMPTIAPLQYTNAVIEAIEAIGA
jgi:hypothetical protein